MPYITRIIQTDSRYIEEKEARKQENKEKQTKENICTKQKRKRKTRKTGLSEIIGTNK